MKDWQRCMDGFSSTSKLKKPFLPSISSYHHDAQECSQKIENIMWSSSEDEENPCSNNKKLVVMKLNFEECVLGPSGQIKARVIRSVNKTQQEVPIQDTVEPDDGINVLPNDKSPVHTPSPQTCTSPIINYKSSRRKKVASCAVNLSDSLTTDIIPLLDSPTVNTYSQKSPIISTRKRKRNSLNQVKNSDNVVDCTLTPRPCSPILSRRKVSCRRKSSSPVLGKSRTKVRRKRRLLDSDAETQVKFPECRQDICQVTQPHNSPKNKIIECSQDSPDKRTHSSAALIKVPEFCPYKFQVPQVLHHGSSQENNIEECSQDSVRNNTTIHCIEVPSSQEVEKIKFPSQSESSQIVINMTPSSAEEVAKIDVLSSPSTGTFPSPVIDLDSASKSKARMAKNGLAQRLHRLVNRKRSEQRMWRHERQLGSSPEGGLALRVDSLRLYCTRWLALCHTHDTKERLLLLLDPELMTKDQRLRPGSLFTIFPPWQSFEPVGFAMSVILSVRLMEVTHDSSASQVIENKTDIKHFTCPCSQDANIPADLCPLRLAGEGRDLVKTMFLGGESAGTRLRAVDAVEERMEQSHSGEMSQVMSIADAVQIHDTNPSASLHIVLSVLRVCNYNAPGVCIGARAVPPSQATQEFHCLLLGCDRLNQLCQVELRTGSDQIKEGATFHFRDLTLAGRMQVTRTPGLLSMVQSLQPTSEVQQQFIYEFSAAKCAAVKLDEDQVWLPPSTTFLAHVTQAAEGRLTLVAKVLLAAKSSLYVTDLSLVNNVMPYTLVSIRKSANVPPLSTSSIVCLRDTGCYSGSLFLDKYSCVTDLTNYQASETVDVWQAWLLSLSPLVTGLCTLKPQLPPLSSQSEISHLVQLQGAVCGVDEESAYSWPVCVACSSDLLQELPDNRLRCALCASYGPFPNHVELSIFLQPDPALHHLPVETRVKVKLQQRSVELLLPGCLNSHDGYQLDTVLGQSLGPLECVVTSYEDSKYDMEELAVSAPS